MYWLLVLYDCSALVDATQIAGRPSVEQKKSVYKTHPLYLVRQLCQLLRISPVETLLADQTTSSDEMIIPSGDLLLSQSVGGRNVCAVRLLASDSRC